MKRFTRPFSFSLPHARLAIFQARSHARRRPRKQPRQFRSHLVEPADHGLGHAGRNVAAMPLDAASLFIRPSSMGLTLVSSCGADGTRTITTSRAAGATGLTRLLAIASDVQGCAGG